MRCVVTIMTLIGAHSAMICHHYKIVFVHVPKTAGQSSALPGLPISRRSDSAVTVKSKRYQDYYDEEFRDLFAELHRRDIELFGYSFDQATPE